MNLGAYSPVLIQATLALVIAAAILGASHIFGQRSKGNKVKDTAYECGLPSIAQGQPRFAIKFNLTAMLFIIFDIEAIFLIPLVIIYRDFLSANIPILMPMLFFLLVLVIGLVYELRKGALQWER